MDREERREVRTNGGKRRGMVINGKMETNDNRGNGHKKKDDKGEKE